jgi:uncharacterized protein YsxB (DUF464 family)
VIAAKVVLDEKGGIARFEATGHAGRGKAGQDIVCAAFTVLARTAYETLLGFPGAVLDIVAPEPGILRFRVKSIGSGSPERAAGVADFLLAGLSGLEREYPAELGLSIERNWRE